MSKWTDWVDDYINQIYSTLYLPLAKDVSKPKYFIGRAPIWRNDPIMDVLVQRWLDEFRSSRVHGRRVTNITDTASALSGGIRWFRKEYLQIKGEPEKDYD